VLPGYVANTLGLMVGELRSFKDNFKWPW